MNQSLKCTFNQLDRISESWMNTNRIISRKSQRVNRVVFELVGEKSCVSIFVFFFSIFLLPARGFFLSVNIEITADRISPIRLRSRASERERISPLRLSFSCIFLVFFLSLDARCAARICIENKRTDKRGKTERTSGFFRKRNRLGSGHRASVGGESSVTFSIEFVPSFRSLFSRFFD